MRIAIAQLNYTIGAFENNKLKIMDAVQRAKADGADLVVFAEQSISGAPAYDLLNKVNFLDLCEEALVEIAACCDGISALVGLPVQEGRWTVSAAAFIQNRKIVGYITRKHILQRDDATFLYPGRGREFIQVAGRKIAVVVGEDIMHPDECSGCADAVINIGSSKYARQRIEKRYDFFAGMAYRLGTDVVFVNQVGANTDVIYDGSSAVFSAEGKPLALLAGFEEDYRVVELGGVHEPMEVPYQDKTRNVYRAIKLGLADFSVKTVIPGLASDSPAVSIPPLSRRLRSKCSGRKTSGCCLCRRSFRATIRWKMPCRWYARSVCSTTSFPLRTFTAVWSIA